MKLDNGTVVEVGKKYVVHSLFTERVVVKVLHITEKSLLMRVLKDESKDEGGDYLCTVREVLDWIPYEEEYEDEDYICPTQACEILTHYIKKNGFPKDKCELIHTTNKGFYSFEQLMEKIYDQTEEQWAEYWDKLYRKQQKEEKKEKWYEVLEERGFTNTREMDYVAIYTIEPSESYIILREWNSKEEMINDLKKG